jgi:hypothetical protein
VGTGTVTIRDSYNVSSITDAATGTYEINFQRPFGYAAGATGYAAFVSCRVNANARSIAYIDQNPTIGNAYNVNVLRVRCVNNALAAADPDIVTAIVYT